MTIHTAAVAALSIGQTGAWVGPLIVGGAAAALDYSAAGATALRDRIAVMGYYASAVSFVYLLGFSTWITSLIDTDYNWRMAGACFSLVTHGALLVCWFNWPKALVKGLAKRLKWASADSAAAKINQTLLGWTVAAALSSPLSGSGGWGKVVNAIAGFTTGIWSWIVAALFHWLGG